MHRCNSYNDTMTRVKESQRAKKLQQDKHMNKLFMLKRGIVYRLWCEDDKTAECVVVPEVLRDPLLMLAHNYSGHNGFRRTYNAMK